MVFVADGVARVPEFRGNACVGGIFHGTGQFSPLDDPSDLARPNAHNKI